MRTVSLSGAIFTLVGYVIGASIFILPGQLAADAGPGVFISYLLAGTLAAISCVVAAVIGSALPVSGAAHVTNARVLGPLFGFVGVWVTLVAVALGVSFVAYGVADYVGYFVPGLNRMGVALASAIVFGALNLTTVRATVWLQAAMTIGFLIVLLGFGIGGTLNANPELLTPIMPNGFAAVAAAAVPAFFSFAGAGVITEIGGEIKNPTRNIPLSLLYSFLIVASSYALVSFAVPALLPWHSLKDVDAPLARAALVFMPSWVGGVVALGALLAAATSINGMVLIHSRDVLAMARARVFPETLARRNAKDIPVGAVLFVTGLSILGILAAATIREYAVMAVMGVMVIQIFSSITIVRLPRKMPAEFAQSGFKLTAPTRMLFAWLCGLSSAGFVVLGIAQGVRIAIIYLAIIAVGIGYYYWRRSSLDRSGYSIDAVLRSGSSAEG